MGEALGDLDKFKDLLNLGDLVNLWDFKIL